MRTIGPREGPEIPSRGPFRTSADLPPRSRRDDPMRIALDAMGGDHAPGPIVTGAVEAVRDRPDLTVVLVGDRERVEVELARAHDADRDRLPVVHTSQVIGMEEKPVEALRKKRDNSISRSWGLIASGEVNAVV